MNCVQTRTILLGKETGQFSQSEIAGAESHVSTCEACSRFFRYNSGLQEFLKQKLVHVVTPPQVRESLLQKITQPKRTTSKFSKALHPSSRIVRVAAAVLIVLTGAMALYLGLIRHHDDVSSQLPSLLVQDHIEIQIREHPFDIQTSDKSELEQWFGKRVDFAVSIPTLHGTKLQGGRLCYLLGRRVAFIVFEKENKPISTYILDASGLDLSSMGHVVVHQNKGICRASERGFNVVLWKTNGLIYALVSRCRPEELETLATSL